VVDIEDSAACGCEDGWVTLGFGGRELPALVFFKGNSIFLRFSLAQAFLRLPFAYGTSAAAGLHPCNSVASPLYLRRFSSF
jgi:hypothetical protein